MNDAAHRDGLSRGTVQGASLSITRSDCHGFDNVQVLALAKKMLRRKDEYATIILMPQSNQSVISSAKHSYKLYTQVLALAKKMLRRKDKESIIDAAYNRYAFHDTGLPRWFSEDERRHMRCVTKVFLFVVLIWKYISSSRWFSEDKRRRVRCVSRVWLLYSLHAALRSRADMHVLLNVSLALFV